MKMMMGDFQSHCLSNLGMACFSGHFFCIYISLKMSLMQTMEKKKRDSSRMCCFLPSFCSYHCTSIYKKRKQYVYSICKLSVCVDIVVYKNDYFGRLWPQINPTTLIHKHKHLSPDDVKALKTQKRKEFEKVYSVCGLKGYF